MQNRIFMFMLGLLLVGTNLYAAGDLQVNGSLGVGTAPVAGAKVVAEGNNTNSLIARSITDGTDSVDAVKGFMNINIADNTSKGLAFQVNYNSSSAGGSGIIAVNDSSMSWNTASTDGLMSTSLIQLSNNVNNDHTGTSTPILGYGVNLLSAGGSGTGSVHYSAYYRHIGIPDLGDRFRKSPGVNMDGAVTGIWMDQQTRGSNNYGIVLNGDGAGSDIVFGPTQSERIYSDSGRLYAQDSFGNQTILSPHDPETGEWIYFSKNTKTGVIKKVNMEKLVRAIERLTGETFMIESIEEIK